MKTIIAPTDFSSVSKNALVYASVLARKTGATLTLFNAYQPYIANSMMSEKLKQEQVEIFRKESLKELNSMRKAIMFKGKVRCNVVNRQGEAKEEILGIIDERSPDLLVMGTQSRSAIDKIIFGNVVGNVVKNATCPVLVVPENTPFKVPRKIAFAMDYHDSDIESIKFLTKLAKVFKAEITVLHVAAADLPVERNFLNSFKEEVSIIMPNQLISYQLIKGKNIGRALNMHINKLGIDMIAVAKTHKSLLAQMLKGSISRQLFLHTHIPLLVLQADDET